MRGVLRTNFWLGLQPLRTFSSSNSCWGVDKALLSKLRKQTGVPFIKCKKALEQHDNNFDESKKWLLAEAQKAGWERATKLGSRPMSQGLVAMLGDHEKVMMVEVNCETDFVAKNEKFITMVQQLTEDCKLYFEKQEQKQILAGKEELNKIKSSTESSLFDKVAMCIGDLGENMALRRGVFLRADDNTSLCYYAHPKAPGQKIKGFQMGKYGAVVEMHGTQTDGKPVMKLADFGSHLCQHIVGMNPKTLGKSFSESDVTEVKGESDVSEMKGESDVTEVKGKRKGKGKGKKKKVNEGDDWRNLEPEDKHITKTVEIEENALLQQDFILDTTMKVGQLACLNGVEVKGFVRFGCGEEIAGEEGQ